MIGIFDSGVGGLSVLNEISLRCPGTPLLYFADTKFIPYGDKSEEFLCERSLAIAAFLQNKGAKILVVACNTATAAAAEQLRETISIPIVAVEPPLKPAVKMSTSGVVGVLATEVTLRSQRFRRLIESYGAGAHVIERASNDLVPLVENHLWQTEAGKDILLGIIDEFLNKEVDTVVLGSTHFSFLQQSFVTLSKGRLAALGPAEATANQVVKVLGSMPSQSAAPELTKMWVSGDAAKFAENLKYFSQAEAKIFPA